MRTRKPETWNWNLMVQHLAMCAFCVFSCLWMYMPHELACWHSSNVMWITILVIYLSGMASTNIQNLSHHIMCPAYLATLFSLQLLSSLHLSMFILLGSSWNVQYQILGHQKWWYPLVCGLCKTLFYWNSYVENSNSTCA